jgi:ribosomal protein S27AE
MSCSHGFRLALNTSNLYRLDEQTIEKKTSNDKSCPNCGQVSTHDEYVHE